MTVFTCTVADERMGGFLGRKWINIYVGVYVKG